MTEQGTLGTRAKSRVDSPLSYPQYPNHFVPRTPRGKAVLALFVLLFALAEPPTLYVFANRIEPWLFGLPFLYGYLLIVYTALIGLLIWAHRRGL
jgi:hypothetical protein